MVEKLSSIFLGLIVGALGAVAHQTMLKPWNVPIGLILGAILVSSTLIWWYEKTDYLVNTVITGVSAMVVTVAMVFMPFHSLLIPTNWQGYTWAYGLPFFVLLHVMYFVQKSTKAAEKLPYPSPVKALH